MREEPGTPKPPASGLLLAAQIRYHVRLLLANGRTVAICIGLPVILLVTSGISHGHASAAAVASSATFGLTLAAWNAGGVRLVAAREAGVLKRWRATPLPRWCYFLGRIIATVAVGTLAGTVTVAVSVCFYHVHLTAGSAVVMLVVFALGAAAWAAAATALSSAIPTVDAAFPVLILIYFPVLVVSGLLGSISEPRWLTTIASYLPVRPLADAVTSALRHASGTPLFPAQDLLTFAVWAAAGLAAAMITFRWEPHRPTRRRAARATPARDESIAPAARLALATQPQESSPPTAMR
jgi:ABC-2 type transport system permease protein